MKSMGCGVWTGFLSNRLTGWMSIARNMGMWIAWSLLIAVLTIGTSRSLLHATLAAMVLVVAIGIAVARSQPRKLVAVMALGWMLRITLLAFFTVQSHLSGTGDYYLRSADAAGYHLFAKWVLEADSWVPLNRAYSYSYIVAALYKVFGPDPNVANILNIGISLVIVPYIYELGRQCGGSRAGLLAATAYVMYPSMILWSVSTLKDVWIVLALVIFAKSTASMSRGQSHPQDFIGLIVSCSLLAFLRYQYVLILPVGLLLSIVLCRNRHGRSLFPRVMAASIMILIVSVSAIGTMATGLATKSLEDEYWLDLQRGALEGGSGISALAGVPAKYRWMAQLPFVILAPFPWQWITTSSGINRLSGLETAIMYVCYYVIVARRKHWVRNVSSTATVACALAVFAAVSLSVPNVGTMYRYRLAGNILILPVAIAELVRWKGKKPYRDGSSDLSNPSG